MPPSTFASQPHRRTLTAIAATLLLAANLPILKIQAQQDQARIKAFLAQRIPADHTSPAAALLRAQQQHKNIANPQNFSPQISSLTAAWQPLGPASITSATYGALTGRITALALDPNDTSGNTLYVGTTGGGVWKSTNAASLLSTVTFTPLTYDLPAFSSGAIPSLSIGALALQPAANPILLAGTGDPNDATDSYYGEGLLRSTDGGITWSLVTQSNDGPNGHHSFAGLATAAIAFSTATPQLAVAALSTSIDATLTNATSTTSVPGLYYTTDAGITWQMATLYDGTHIVQQPLPAGSPATGNAATAVLWNPVRAQFIAAIRAHGYYSSPDGITWTRLIHQPGPALTTANCPVVTNATTCPIFRAALAVEPTSGDLYALTTDANNNDQGLYQDLCSATANTCASTAPTFATRIDNAALDTTNTTVIAQADYNLTLAAVATPTGTNLYAGTTDLYRCSIATNTSTCLFRNTTNALNGCNAPAHVAPAQHAIATFSQTTAPILFLGNDGGLWRSLDGVAETSSVCDPTDSTHFDNLNPNLGASGSLAEINGFAQHPTDLNTLLAGLGANGTASTTAAASLTTWPQLSTGEGNTPAIDPNTPTNWLITIGPGINLKQCTLGTLCAAANFTPPATLGEAQVAYDAALIAAPTLIDPALTTNILLGTCRIYRGPIASPTTWSTSNILSPAFDGTTPTTCSATQPLIRSIASGGPTTTNASTQFNGSQVLYAGLAGTLDGGGTLAGSVFVTKTANQPFTLTSWSNIANNPVTNDVANAHLFNPAAFDISSLTADIHDPTGATVYATIMGFGASADTALPHVYRSTDFGAHWLNITANLPDAPANMLLVDPNDANTLYVATDTGVYTTTAVTTCDTVNCWSPYGTALPNSPALSLAAAPQLLTGDGRRGLLRVGTYGRGIWQIPLLTAIPLAQPAITLSPTSFTFASQQAQTQSTPQTLTVTSTGNAPASFGQATLSTNFTLTADTCSNQTLAVNAICTLSIAFAPTTTGPLTGTLTLYANIPTGQATVALSGTAITAADITLNPTSLTFPDTLLNQTTAAQIITVNNTGGTTATLQTPVITGDFALLANTCNPTLAPSTACSLSITFTPTAANARTGTLSLTDVSTGLTSIQTASLTGTGDSPATDTLSTNALTFAQQQVATTSPTQQVTVTNAGNVALSLLAPTINSADFTVTNNCGASLPGKTTCAYTLAFVPTATGTRTATLTITDTIHSQTVTLTGLAVAPPGVSLSPTSLTFPATGNGLTSLPQTVTLTNNGGVPLIFSAIAISPNFAIAQNNCPTTLPVNTPCTLQLLFAPATAGPLTGSLTLTDNAPIPTQTVNLSGLAIDFALTPTGPTTQTLTSGGNAIYTLALTSLPTVTGNVAFACTGNPTNSTCIVSPSAPTLGGSTNIAATILTGIHASTDPGNIAPWRQTMPIFLALLLPLTLLTHRRKRSTTSHLTLLTLTLLTALTTLTGCGSGRAIPAASPTTPTYPTPTGTYNLTITATAAGLSHKVPLTLTIQ